MSDPSNPAGNIPPHIFAQVAALLSPFLGTGNAPQPSLSEANSASTPSSAVPTASGQPPLNIASAPLPVSSPLTQSVLTHPSPSLSAHPQASSSILPVISPYQSLHLPPSQGSQRFHPYSRPGTSSLSQSTGASSQQHPHLGFHNTRNANQQRLASASATLPRRVSLAPRTTRAASSPVPGPNGPGRRTRGAAGQLPSMAPPSGFDLAIFESAANGVAMIKLRAKIYPPLVVRRHFFLPESMLIELRARMSFLDATFTSTIAILSIKR